MSFTQKLIDLARSNLNALLEKAAETADPRRKLASVPDAELEAELERRRAARVTEANLADAKVRVGAGDAKPPPDRATRERQAQEREARVRAERAARAAAQQARASARASDAARNPRPGPTSSGSRKPPPPRRGGNPELARYYERLEVPIGSDFETVKTAYRALMRKYHPDLHGHKSPEKLKAATEVSQALTQAYNELEKALRGGPNQG